MTSYVELVDCLRLRFDAYSARAVLDEMLELASLPVKALYRPDEVRELATRLALRRDRLEQAVGALVSIATPEHRSAP